MATADLHSDGNNAGTLTFAPNLQSSVANDETITFASVPFVCSFTTDITSFNTDTSNLYALNFELVEIF